MTITDVVEISKTKAEIYIDGEKAFALYKSEIRNYCIEKDKEIQDETYHSIIDNVLVKRARLRTLNLLKSRDYTVKQLRNKLKQGAYPENIIDDAIAYAESYGYIDDVKYSEAYIRYAGASKSKKQIERDLIKKGVSNKDIENAYRICEEGNMLVKEEELIEKLMRKKHFDFQSSTEDERQKFIASLYRKGFSLDKIYKIAGK